MAAKSTTKPAEGMGLLPLPLVVATVAAAPFRMAFKRLPKDNPRDGAAHRQRAMLKDEHCLIDSINTTLKRRATCSTGRFGSTLREWWD